MKHFEGVVGISRQGIRAKAGAASFDRRKKRSHGFAAEPEALHVMLFERDGIEIARNGVAFDLGVLEAFDWLRLEPAQPLHPSALRNRSAFEISPYWIHQPHAGFPTELRAKPETVLAMCEPNRFIRRFGQGKLWIFPTPFLIGELGRFQADRLVEVREKAVRVLQLIDGRSLVHDQPLAVDQKFVLLGLPAEDRVVLKNQALRARACLTLKK